MLVLGATLLDVLSKLIPNSNHPKACRCMSKARAVEATLAAKKRLDVATTVSRPRGPGRAAPPGSGASCDKATEPPDAEANSMTKRKYWPTIASRGMPADKDGP